MLILLASVASAATAVSRIRIASISGNAHILLLPGEAHRSGEPFGHDLGDVGQMVQLREEPLHLLASHVAPELVHIFDVEGHDILVGRSRVRAEQAAHPVIPPVVDRREVLHGRRVGVEDPALVVLRVNTILEVDQYYHRRHRITSLARLHDDLLHVAPDPVLSGLEGLDYRVLGGVEVPGRVLVWRLVAASYVPADEALAQVDPGVAHLQALLAALGARGDVPDLIQVRALWRGRTEQIFPFQTGCWQLPISKLAPSRFLPLLS